MAYYLHGTPAVNLNSILTFNIEKPISAWMCSDRDDFFYLWDVSRFDRYCEEELQELETAITKRDLKHPIGQGITEAMWSALVQMASHPSKYVLNSQVAVLLIEVPDNLVDSLVEDDISAENMFEARAMDLKDLPKVIIHGFWPINTSIFYLPHYAADLIDRDYFVLQETDPLVCKLIESLKGSNHNTDLWELVDDWISESAFVWLTE